ncbi:MAG: FAD-binding oxidoreductase [Microthrixaceae bacterium]
MDKWPDDRLVTALAAVVGAANVLVDPVSTARYRHDWTGGFGTDEPVVVVRPADVSEVAAVVARCADSGVDVVCQGGNTGLVGGSVPCRSGVVVATERMRGLSDFDEESGQLTAGAGTTLAQLHEAVSHTGWRYAVDFGARDSATVGGMVATNAGGVHTFRHGMTRAQVLGLEVVRPDGAVLSHLGGVRKDNTGYDLAGLWCGSEGTLGVICRARLALIPRPAAVVTALVGFSSVAEALDAAWRLAREVRAVEVIELMDRTCLASGGHSPVVSEAALLVEVATEADSGGGGCRDGSDEVSEALDRVHRRVEATATGTAVATSSGERRALWAIRDGITEAMTATGAVAKYDVSIPGPAMLAVLDEVRVRLAVLAPHARLWVFGHVADHNLHLNVTDLDGASDADRRSVTATVMDAVARRGGSISAEHGIGRLKRDWLDRSRRGRDRHDALDQDRARSRLALESRSVVGAVAVGARTVLTARAAVLGGFRVRAWWSGALSAV